MSFELSNHSQADRKQPKNNNSEIISENAELVELFIFQNGRSNRRQFPVETNGEIIYRSDKKAPDMGIG